MSIGHITGCTVMEANNPDFAEPTLGMVLGDSFYYVGSSQWGAFNGDGEPVPEEELKPHIIFRTHLD